MTFLPRGWQSWACIAGIVDTGCSRITGQLHALLPLFERVWCAQVRAVIPRRSSLPGDRGVLIVCNATHKTRKGFFFLLQVIGWWDPVAQATVSANSCQDDVQHCLHHIDFACPAAGRGSAWGSWAGGAGA